MQILDMSAKSVRRSTNIVVFFTIFFIVSFAFRVDSKVSVSDFGVDILFGEAGELSVQNVCVLGFTNIGLEGRKPMSEEVFLEFLNCLERVIRVEKMVVVYKRCKFKNNRILLIVLWFSIC